MEIYILSRACLVTAECRAVMDATHTSHFFSCPVVKCYADRSPRIHIYIHRGSNASRHGWMGDARRVREL